MSTLMVSISGVRGIIGQSLTPEVVQRYALAFGSYMRGKTIIVGSDSRTSGRFIKNIVKGCLQSTGCRVIDIGIVATPTVQMEILHHRAAGGVAITASHNPSEWNGLKFMNGKGQFLSPDQAAEVYELADKENYKLEQWQNAGTETTDNGANARHIKKILDLPYIDLSAIKQRKFSVVIDCVNGAGGLIVPKLLDKLGCTVTVINGEANGQFAHTPEPLPQNLGQLKKQVKLDKADIGFAVDPDVDRCAIVDNTGNTIGEEYTLALAVKFILSKKLGPVVVNMSTSRASEDIAKYYNCPFIRSKVGEINVVGQMEKNEAVIGGEGNGGVILPEVHLGRDAPVAIALTLQQLLEFDGPVNAMIKTLPQYTMIKDKINIEGKSPDRIIEKLTTRFKDKKVNIIDGLKIDEKEYWVHLRKSNTEPIMRIIAEAKTKKMAKEVVNTHIKLVNDLT